MRKKFDSRYITLVYPLIMMIIVVILINEWWFTAFITLFVILPAPVCLFIQHFIEKK